MNNCEQYPLQLSRFVFFFYNIDHVTILKGIVLKFAARTYMCIKYENPLESVTVTAFGKHTVQAISITKQKSIPKPLFFLVKLMKNTETQIFELQT